MNARETKELLSQAAPVLHEAKLKLPLQACSLTADPSSVDRKEVDQALAGAAGYAVFTDEVVRFAEGLAEGGHLLSADAVLPGGKASVQVRWDGTTYLMTKYTEADGTSHLAYDEVHLSVRRGHRVRYRVYLHPCKEGDPAIPVWRPFAARLLGLDGGTKES